MSRTMSELEIGCEYVAGGKQINRHWHNGCKSKTVEDFKLFVNGKRPKLTSVIFLIAARDGIAASNRSGISARTLPTQVWTAHSSEFKTLGQLKDHRSEAPSDWLPKNVQWKAAPEDIHGLSSISQPPPFYPQDRHSGSGEERDNKVYNGFFGKYHAGWLIRSHLAI